MSYRPHKLGNTADDYPTYMYYDYNILDRLLHHSHVINIKGTSYRIKDKLEHLCDNEYEK